MPKKQKRHSKSCAFKYKDLFTDKYKDLFTEDD